MAAGAFVRPSIEVGMPSDNTLGLEDLTDAAAVQGYLRNRAQDGVKVGPFSILFSPGDRSPFANYAIPGNDARPSPAEDPVTVATRRSVGVAHPTVPAVPIACSCDMRHPSFADTQT